MIENSALPCIAAHREESVWITQPVPLAVIQAMKMDWGVLVDAYLVDAARVGRSYAATVFSDHSGTILDGTTVATLPLALVKAHGPYKLMRTIGKKDHYVIVSEHQTGDQRNDV